MGELIGYECKKCKTFVNTSDDRLSFERKLARVCCLCVHESNKYSINFKNVQIRTSSIKPFFDFSTGKEITSRDDIKRIEKERNWIYTDDSDIEKQADSNKSYRINEINTKMGNELEKELGKILND